MNPVWEKAAFDGHAEGVKSGQTKAAAGQLSAASLYAEPKQSTSSSDHPENNFLPPLPQQNPLLLSPASLQLAQLQAQLTLQRIKLAQTAVSGNNAAAVLNQVLSNVAMSQPLFNQLRAPTMMAGPRGPSFPFPPQGALVGAGFSGGTVQNQNPTGIRMNRYGGPDYGKKPGPPITMASFAPDSERQAQFGFGGGTPANSSNCSNGQFAPKPSFHREFTRAPQPDHNLDPKEMWANMHPQGGKGEAIWSSSNQEPPGRSELYNPEEPTPDCKYNPVQGFGSGAPGFAGYQPGGEVAPVRGSIPLMPQQLDDYHGVTPTHVPHHCTICDKTVFNHQDWDQHVKAKLHLQNRALFTESSATAPLHYPSSSEGCPNPPGNTSMAYSSAASQVQDAPSAANAGYLSAGQMKAHPLTGAGFPLHPTGAQFPPRTSPPGRVVHICNLPEGSCTENDVINLGLPFGKVTNYILMRSTHQAFLEMAFVEAAHAMVKYYQLQPATINEQKLLIRMSKRYKELQLKKPGKDVESIIQDINSQRERDEMQELEHYPAERPRSRSPLSRSLSPSFTSCSSAHSPAGNGGCRGDRSNGLGPRCGSWEWSRDDGCCWNNGDEERLNSRRKPPPYPGRVERYGRDRGSPLAGCYSHYRSMEEDFYDRARMPYPRHDKRERKELSEVYRSRTPEDRRPSPPSRGRSRKSSKKPEVEKEGGGSSAQEGKEAKKKEKSASPPRLETERLKESVTEVCESGDEKEEEFWYPKNMEELVTVDEVGEEDDGLIEPDLPDLPEEPAAKDAPGEASEKKLETPSIGEEEKTAPLQETRQEVTPDTGSTEESPAEERSVPDISSFPSPGFQAAFEDSFSCQDPDKSQQCEESKAMDPPADAGGDKNSAKPATEEVLPREEPSPDPPKKESQSMIQTPPPSQPDTGIRVASAGREQDKGFSEHTIPLGVEFIVPRSGFYCKLCHLFYPSEEEAKTSHCRSTVHYRNLQRYLSQLAEGNLLDPGE